MCEVDWHLLIDPLTLILNVGHVSAHRELLVTVSKKVVVADAQLIQNQ